VSHPKDTIYPILRTTSSVDGTGYQEILDMIPGKPFGKQDSVSSDGLCVCIDDASGADNWGLYVSQEPRLNELKFILPAAPNYVPNNAHLLLYEGAQAVTETVATSEIADDGWSWFGSEE
jgi:hypothetical protein